jgi:HEAT repeat protein
MQGLGIVQFGILVMVGLNSLIILLTVAVKGRREFRQRRLKQLYGRIEPDLDSFLLTGEISEAGRRKLTRLWPWELDILAASIIERISLLRGTEQQRLVRLARELGLVDRYLKQLRSRRRWVRARAAENLGYLGGPEEVEPLARLLSDDDETVRAVAARALARIGSEAAARSLARSLDDASELTSLRVADNLEKLGPLAVGSLLGALRSRKRQARLLAVRVLGNLKATEARGALRRIVRHDWDPNVKAQAVLALGKIGDPEDLPEILQATRDEAWFVRVQGANALGMIGEASTTPVLQALMSDREWWVRVNAGRALANMGAAGERALVETLESPDRFARDRAAAILEDRGAIRRVVERLCEPDETARNTVRAMVRAGATSHLRRLAETMPETPERETLRTLLEQARGS